MKRAFSVLLTLSILSLIAGLFQPIVTRAQSPGSLDIDNAVKSAFQTGLEQNRLAVLGFMMYEPEVFQIDYSKDGSAALLWIQLLDRNTGQVVATEPGLAIAQLTNSAAPALASSWTVVFPGSDAWKDEAQALPADLMTPYVYNMFFAPASTDTQASTPAFIGYKLPWQAGLKKYITNSIGHVYTDFPGGWASCPSSCRYAYDWADGTHFQILASKGGTIAAFSDGCPNNDHTCTGFSGTMQYTNYLAIRDDSTSPTTYDLYFHLEQGSIREKFRHIGAIVLQGDYLANADNTGASTGSHLHFQVYISPTWKDYYWGNSVDFKYDEVTDNDGHPRTCNEAKYHPELGSQCQPDNGYVSANVLVNPPSGTLEAPVDLTTITTQSMLVGGVAVSLNGWAPEKVYGRWNGADHLISSVMPDGTGAYYQDVDLCAGNVPDGPFDMWVKINDVAGGQVIASPGKLHLFKNFSCQTVAPVPPPACQPAVNQVALYTGPDYSGSCKLFSATYNAGNYLQPAFFDTSALGSLGDNAIVSVMVGADVRAVLYDLNSDLNNPAPTGRIETVSGNDANLDDNPIGAKRVSALMIKPNIDFPLKPVITAVGPRWDGAGITSSDSLVLAWNNGAGETTFNVSLKSTNTTAINKSWTGLTRQFALSIGNLPPGNYAWSAVALNSIDDNGSNGVFTVAADPTPPPAPAAFPFFDDFESASTSWKSTGLWRRASETYNGRTGATQAYTFSGPTGYGDSVYRSGDLTSPPIPLPASASSYLTFTYYADVEGNTPYWDQRLVQVIDDAGVVHDLYQLSDDKELPDQYWIKAPPLDLSAYKGKTVRIRFHFDVIDRLYNSGQGWTVDDVRVGSQGPVQGCTDTGHASPGAAQAITLGGSIPRAMICPQGEVDYYKFDGLSGDTITASVSAQKIGSALDSQLFLIDSDGQSVLASNDDIQEGVNTDSSLSYRLKRTGTYYLKVKGWDSPEAGGTNFYYDLSVNRIVPKPPSQVAFLPLAHPGRLPNVPTEIKVQATDFDGGPVSKVDFFVHGPDWTNGDWIKASTDSDGSDGWSFMLDPAILGKTPGTAVYALATNAQGGVLGQSLWNLGPDLGIPLAVLFPLDNQTLSTLALLRWNASDPRNDLDHFEIRFQENGGSGFGPWQTLPLELGSRTNSAWFAGKPGYSYNFQIRGVDAVGNVEPYSADNGTTTTFASACTPDAYEPGDNTIDTATDLAPGEVQQHNLCRNDVDFVTLDTTHVNHPGILIESVSGGAAFSVDVYDISRAKIATLTSNDYGESLHIDAFRGLLPPGVYTLAIHPLTADLFGTNVVYRVRILSEPRVLFMPFMYH